MQVANVQHHTSIVKNIGSVVKSLEQSVNLIFIGLKAIR